MVRTDIEVYYTPSSPQCRAVVMCIKALGLEVELIKLDLYQKFEHKKPWFLRLNPQHTVPTLNDGGFVLWESRAIMCYLVNKFGDGTSKSNLYPNQPVEIRATIDRMLFFDIGTLYKSILDYYHPMINRGEDGDTRKLNCLKTAIDYLDNVLANQNYVSGDQLTIADLSILASITQLRALDFPIVGYSHLETWYNNLKSELPYFEECNSEGMELFRKWVKNQQPKPKSSRKIGVTNNIDNTVNINNNNVINNRAILPRRKSTERCEKYEKIIKTDRIRVRKDKSSEIKNIPRLKNKQTTNNKLVS